MALENFTFYLPKGNYILVGGWALNPTGDCWEILTLKHITLGHLKKASTTRILLLASLTIN